MHLSGTWRAFDLRNHVPRLDRVLMARGRDAADTALMMTFGTKQLESSKVWTDEVSDAALRQLRCLPFVANLLGSSLAPPTDAGRCVST